MTNPNDHWRHQTSAAPHSSPHDVQTPGLPLGGGQPASAFDSSSYAGPVTSGSPGSGFLTTTVVVFLFCAPIFGTLYPLSAGAALAAGLVANAVLRVAAPNLGADGRLPFALLAGAIVFWTVSRRDHRLAESVPAYRMVRHVARIVLIGTFVAATSLNKFDRGSWPRSFAQIGVLLADPRFLPTVAVVAVIAHFALTRTTEVRRKWHIWLEIFRLRPGF